MTNAVALRSPSNDAGVLLEKVMLANDLAGLTPHEKLQHIKNMCDSLGLNPMTRPIQLIKFQGKEITYFTKEATEQLRKVHNVSITSLVTQVIGDLYVVTANASMPGGKTDASTGVISIKGISGDALANAFMKAESKAKRRVTLSICGLGFIDESETDTMPKAVKVNVYEEPAKIESIERNGRELDLKVDLEDIRSVDSLEGLESAYKRIYKCYVAKKDKEGLALIIKAKDEKKAQLEKTIADFKAELDADAICI